MKALLFLFRLRPSDKALAVRREIDLIARQATCIPENDAMRCGGGHIFNGRFAKNCPCGSEYGWSVEPSPLRARLAEVRRNA